MNNKYSKKIILCRPDKTPITIINGVQADTVSYTEYIKDFHTLTFSVDRYQILASPNSSGSRQILVESNGYEQLHAYMLLYLEDIGYFQLQEPLVEFDGFKESKNITAYAVYKELEYKDLVGFSVNTGEDGSLERYEENLDPLGLAKEYIVFHNPDNPKLSLMHLVLEKMPGWSIGYMDPNIGYEEETKKIGRFSFDIDSQNIYAFLTSTVAPRVYCVFEFDHLNYKIHAYSIYHYGSNTSVYIGLRNLMNSVNVTVNEDSIYTRFHAAGADDLDVRAVNYNDVRVMDLNYFMQEPYLSGKLVKKIKAWMKFRDDNRDTFIGLSKKLADIEEKIAEIQLRVPNDADAWKQWDGMELELLEKNLKYYRATLENLQISTDPNPQYDLATGAYIPIKIPGTDEVNHPQYLACLQAMDNGYGGYYTYLEILNYILPNIEIAIDNLGKPLKERTKYKKDYETNWDLYGIQELKALKKKYQEQLELLEEYEEPWIDGVSKHKGGKDSYILSHERYVEITGYLESIEKKRLSLQQEADSLEAAKEPVNNGFDDASGHHYGRLELIELASMDHDAFDIKEEEQITICSLFHDTDYQNDNILTTSLDTASTTIDVSKTLYDDAVKKLSEVSQPQYEFQAGIDNLLALDEFECWQEEVRLGNYIYVGIRDDYSVKLRIVSKSWNPCDTTSELTVDFSNMITSSSGCTDLSYLLGESNSSGKNSVSSGTGYAKDEKEMLTNLLEMLRKSQSFTGIVNNINNSSIVSGTEGGSIEAIITKYLNSVRLDVGQLNVGNGTNLVRYGLDTFEQFDGDDTFWWEKSPSYYFTCCIDRDNYFYGSRSVKLYYAGSSSNGAHVYLGESSKDAVSPVETGKYYRVSCYVYCEANNKDSSKCEVALHAIHHNYSLTSSYTSSKKEDIPVGKWKRVCMDVFEADSSYPYVSIGIGVITPNLNVWFDAFQIEEVADKEQEAGAFKPVGTTFIRGNNITTGSIVSNNGNFSLNLDTGEVKAKKLSIESNNFTIDEEGNASYSGHIDVSQLNVGIDLNNLMPNGLDNLNLYKDVPYWSKNSEATATFSLTFPTYCGAKCILMSPGFSKSYYLYLGKSMEDAVVPVKPDKFYKMSCYVYVDSENGETSCDVFLRRINHTSNITGYSTYTYNRTVPSGKWTRISSDAFSGTTTYPYVSLGFGASNVTMMVYFAAFQIEEVSSLTQEVSDFKFAGSTIINGSNITTGVIKDTKNNFTIDLTSGTITAKMLEIKSPNFTLSEDGNVWCQNGDFTGNINAITLYAKDALKMYTQAKQSPITIMEIPPCEDDIDYLVIGSPGLSSVNIYKYNSLLASSVYIDDNLTVHDSIISTGLSSGGQYHAICGNYGFIIRNDGRDTYFLLTDSGNADGSFNGLRPFKINNASGYVYLTNGAYVNSLDVGNILVNGITLANSHSHTNIINKSYLAEISSDKKNFRPGVDQQLSLGGTERRWTRVYAMNASISTSDKYEKTNIHDIDERYENMFMDFHPVNYMWKNFEENNTHDRIHCGLISQEVYTAAKKHNLDSKQFATICMDILDEPTDDDRTERWGLAYEELHGLEIHMIQKALTTGNKLKQEIQLLKLELENVKSLLK